MNNLTKNCFKYILLMISSFILLMAPEKSKAGQCLEKFYANSSKTISQGPRFEFYRRLLSKATTYAKDDKLSSLLPKAARDAFSNGRLIFNRQLLASDVPYVSEIRKKIINIKNFPRQLSEVNHSKLLEISDVVLTTDTSVNKGLNAFVRIGVLENGRPVAVVTHKGGFSPVNVRNQFEERVLSAKLLSDLGIGPKFHGLVEGDLHRSYVVDLVIGDAANAENLNMDSLVDRREIFNRLLSVGIASHHDYQEFSNRGKLLIIDPEGYYAVSKLNSAPEIWKQETIWRKVWTTYLPYARPEDSLRYLQILKLSNDPFWQEIAGYLKEFYNFEIYNATPKDVFYFGIKRLLEIN